MQKRAEIGEALGRKYPEQVVLVTTRGSTGSPPRAPSRGNREGRANAVAVGWTCVASSEPWMFLLGIDDQAYTYELIRKTREFVVAFPSEKQARETLYLGTHHGHKLDKLKECGLRTQKAKVVKAPLVADAVANFECRLVEITRPGDCPLIVGEVVASHVNARKGLKRLYTVNKGFKLTGVRSLLL